MTLVELLVALMVGGLTLTMAHGLLAAVADAAARADTAAHHLTAEVNARDWLARAFGSLQSGASPARGFQGVHHAGDGRDADEIEFVTGERTVRVHLEADVLTAVVEVAAGDDPEASRHIPLFRDVRAFTAEYLLDYGEDARWVGNWMSPVSAPLAVRLRLRRLSRTDTLLFLIGPRG